jgi:transposase-like protein
MEEKDFEFNNLETPVIKIMQGIQSGATDPKSLDKQTRQRCVEFCLSEGYQVSQMAQLFNRPERTIYRDLDEIKQRHALAPSLDFAKATVGEMVMKARIAHSQLARTARSKEASPEVRISAEYLSWKVFKELIEKLQTLGYLPSSPQEIVGDFFHHMAEGEGEKNIIEVKNMLLEVEQSAKEAGTFDSKTEEQLKILRARIESAEITLDVNKLKQTQEEAIDKKGEENEK